MNNLLQHGALQMNEEEYISARLDAQIAWYDNKSQRAQSWFKRLRGIEVVAASSIPVIAGIAPEHPATIIIIAILGGLIAVLSALISLNKYQENWLEYRTTCETLKHQKFLYLTGCDPYHTDEAFTEFVIKIEGLISLENSNWNSYVKSPPKNDQSK